MTYKPKAPDVMATPNVIPMADIMLVLLIIFMVVTPLIGPGVPVDMARVSNPTEMQAADRDDSVIVAITRDGQIYLGATQTSRENVAGKIKDLLVSRFDKTVFVKSDARAKYGAVVSVVDEVRSAGVDKIGLLTERNMDQRTAPPPPVSN